MDIKDIQHLIKFVAKSGAQEVKLEMEDIKITIKTGPDQSYVENSGMVQQATYGPSPVQIQAAPVAAAPEAEAPAVSIRRRSFHYNQISHYWNVLSKSRSRQA